MDSVSGFEVEHLEPSRDPNVRVLARYGHAWVVVRVPRNSRSRTRRGLTPSGGGLARPDQAAMCVSLNAEREHEHPEHGEYVANGRIRPQPPKSPLHRELSLDIAPVFCRLTSRDRIHREMARIW